MGRPWTVARVTLTALGLGACSSSPPVTGTTVLITVTGAPAGAALRAYATLDGVDSLAPYDFLTGETRLAIDLGTSAGGALAVAVGATSAGCIVAQGQAEVSLKSPSTGLYQVTVPLASLSPRSCPSPVCLGGALPQSQNLCWDQPLTGTLALSGVWGDSSRLAFAVGDGGVVLRWNGYFFSAEPVQTSAALYGVAGTGPADVWAVGDSGTILHYDGSAWTVSPSPVTSALRSLWVAAPATASQPEVLWAVGDGGVILQSSGGGPFTSQPSPDKTTDFLAIWGSAPDDFWVVGKGGATFHSQGGSTTQPTLTTKDVHAVWGRAQDAVWAVGALGTILFYDGTSLQVQEQQVTTADLYAVWGDDTLVYAAGDDGTLLQYDGTSWLLANTSAPATVTRSLRGLWGLQGGSVFAVGGGGTVLRLDRGTSPAQWQNAIDPSGRAPLYALWGSQDSDLWAVGQATVLHYDGTGWTAPQSGVGVSLYGVGGTSPSDVWLVGDQGYVSHYDGTSFTPLGPVAPVALRGVWSDSPTDLFIVGGEQGAAATLLRSDGKMFTQQMNSAPAGFNGVSGLSSAGGPQVLTAGGGGEVGRYSGTMWNFQPLPQASGVALSGAWVSPLNDQWLFGPQGLLYLYKGSSFAQSLPAPSGTVWAMAGTGGSDVWAVTAPPAVFRYDGAMSFDAVYQPDVGAQSAGFRGIYIGAAGSMWIVDDAGGILHKP